MKKKIISIAVFALLIVMMFPYLCLPIAAIMPNSDITDSYQYSYEGVDIDAPDAYRYVRTITTDDIGVNPDSYEPVDLFQRNGYVYIVNKGGSAIIILDENFKLVKTIRAVKNSPATENDPGYTVPALDIYKYDINGNPQVDPDMTSSSPYSFREPEGIYVDENGLMYVADKGNRRIVVLDIDGYVKNVIQSVKVSLLGKDYIFRPVKLAVDRSGGMHVIAYAVNRGIMELDYDGSFANFIGAPKVKVNAVDWFWRVVSTEEQKKKLVKYVPTEFNNLSQDNRGFLYVTISTISYEDMTSIAGGSTDSAMPVAKLNSAGDDILRRKGSFAPMGDALFSMTTTPQIVDVDSYENGAYVILDQKTGRFFTYDNDGELLFISGGKGNQYGRLKTPYSLCIKDDQIVISDVGNKTLVVYEQTDYAKTVFNALDSHIAGEYSKAEQYWNEVITYNSNMYIAYIGLGKAELRKGNSVYDDTRLEYYENSLKYFEVANEKTYYSTSFKVLQKARLEKYFTLIGISVVLIAGAIIAIIAIRSKKRNKNLPREEVDD